MRITCIGLALVGDKAAVARCRDHVRLTVGRFAPFIATVVVHVARDDEGDGPFSGAARFVATVRTSGRARVNAAGHGRTPLDAVSRALARLALVLEVRGPGVGAEGRR